MKLNYEELYEEYLSGKEVSTLATDNKTHIQTIYSAFKRRNFKTELNRKKRTKTDDFFFNSIDNQEKAYYLGLWYTDGYISKSVSGQNRIGIRVSEKDIELLERFISLVSPDRKILKERNAVKILIASNQLYQDLISLGCTLKKTRDFSIPNIPKHLIPHFIRGAFDGDGSVGKRKARPKQLIVNICSVNLNFLEWVRDELTTYSIPTKIYKENRQGKTYKTPSGECSNCLDMYRLTFNTQESKRLFYQYLYSDSILSLERKKSLFKEYYGNAEVTQ